VFKLRAVRLSWPGIMKTSKYKGGCMLQDSKAFSGFSVDDIAAAKEFYGQTLGLTVEESPMGLTLKLGSGAEVFVYAKPNHEPASFTILNFPVADIDAAADVLISKGVVFEKYEGMHQDEKGIARPETPADGPSIAWFKDPAGNILSILK